ncbi:MAG: tRNA (adenosine(37)-N6)-dimethylallyltransferase MiaA [Oscillospiraceae bacterium]|nr:tRNA (adenosine(37)-N6)-dimethylallyltransferase MiaA [Oscillospiraceae bacterium]
MEEYNNKIPIVVIVGPTASGKSKLAIWLAKQIGGEIISADSMQIYKGMDIGTAKLIAEELSQVPHHMINLIDKNQSFSVADYVKISTNVACDIIKRDAIPILVGGTGLYVDSLIDGIIFHDQKEDMNIRKQLYNELSSFGSDYMLNKLKKIDPKYAKTLHPNNTKRVLRGIEIYIKTGITMSENLKASKINGSRFNACKIGLNFSNRQNLYDRINARVDEMIEKGLIDEAKEIIKFGKCSDTAMQAIGYKEFIPYFAGKQGIDETISQIKQKTRKYAKRQLTWFRKDDDINWIYLDEIDEQSVKSKLLNIVKCNLNLSI